MKRGTLIYGDCDTGYSLKTRLSNEPGYAKLAIQFKRIIT